MTTPKVEIYTQWGCGYCVRAKALLDSKGVAYEEYDVTMGGPKRPKCSSANLMRGPCRRCSSLARRLEDRTIWRRWKRQVNLTRCLGSRCTASPSCR